MPTFRDISIRRKLTLIIMLASTVALLLACAAFVGYELVTFRDAMVRDLFTLAEIIGHNSTAALTFDDKSSAEETLAALSAESHIVSACIYTKDGRTFARYLRGGLDGDLPLGPAEDGHRFEDDHLVLFRSIALDEERIGTVYLQSDLQEMHARLKRYAGIVVIVLLASSLAAFGVSSKLRRVISEPILHLVQTARVVSDNKDYSVRAVKHGQDEVGRLIDAFNEMLAQIQERDATLEQRAEELARSNAELQDFAYVASHDMQEPLRKIQAFGDRLKSQCGDALSDRGRDYLARMQNAAGRMQTLINDLLTFSRVTTKAQPFVPVDLAQVTQKVLSDLEVRIEETGARVEVGDLPTIDADPLQMRQLLQNLIGNGLKFHREEEAPVVEIHSQVLEGEEEHMDELRGGDGVCQLRVKDNGIGFEEKYVDRIFGMFQRLHSRSVYEGTGVGLAICRKIVERHGGHITAKSRPGEGATFVVTLPVKQFQGGEIRWVSRESRDSSVP